MGLKIAITGICSTLAKILVDRLVMDPEVEQIIGLDIREYDGPKSKKIMFKKADVRDPEAVSEALKDVDILIHMAFIVVSNIPKTDVIFDINVNGSKNVFNTAAKSGIKKIIYTSSVASYGFNDDVPHIIDENTPVRGSQNKEFYYAYTKGIVSEYIDEFLKENGQIIFTRLRAQIISGPTFVDETDQLDMVVKGFENTDGKFVRIKPVNTDEENFQLTHEQDFVDVIQYAVHNNLDGVYNIVGSPLLLKEYIKEMKGIEEISYIPWKLAFIVVKIASIFSSSIRRHILPWLYAIKYNFVVKSDKIKQSGYPKDLKTTLEILEEAISLRKNKREREN